MRARKKPLERNAEQRWRKYVRDNGGVTRKLNGLGYRSWPDQLALKPGVKAPLMIEFKRIGEDATLQQQEMHKMLLALGQRVVVCWTFEEAVRAYNEHSDDFKWCEIQYRCIYVAPDDGVKKARGKRR